MDNKNVKKRDVLPFDEFVKAHETALKVIKTKKDENPDPGAHKIKGEDLYVKNDANPYKAFGIEHNEKMADANMKVTANQVDVHDGVTEKKKPTAEDIKAAEESAALIGNAYAQSTIAEVTEGKKSE